MKTGTQVKVFAQISDGQGDVTDAWTDGVVTGEYTVPVSIRQATGERPGIIVNVPASAMKDKNIRIEDSMISTVVRS